MLKRWLYFAITALLTGVAYTFALGFLVWGVVDAFAGYSIYSRTADVLLACAGLVILAALGMAFDGVLSRKR